MLSYSYSQFVKCECGYSWTTCVETSVVCACGATSIHFGVITGVSLAYTDEEVKQAIASDLNINSDDLIIEKL